FGFGGECGVTVVIHQRAIQGIQETGTVEEAVLESQTGQAISSQFFRDAQHVSPCFGGIQHKALVVEESQSLSIDGDTINATFKGVSTPTAIGHLALQFVGDVVGQVQNQVGG